MSSTIGNKLKITLFGESHGAAIGCVIEGFPAGFVPNQEAVNAFMARRAPGATPGSTARTEKDIPEILSGICDGKTTGAPITAIIRNTDARSKDYSSLAITPRPGHADYTLAVKTGGNNDIRGGGHSSGRIMAGLCYAGALALQYLNAKGISVNGKIDTIGGIKISGDKDSYGLDEAARQRIQEARENCDSIGGTISCSIEGIPAGYGAPIFDGVENRLAAILFGIPAVKGVEFGSGFYGSTLLGSQNNDPFSYKDGQVVTESNNHGGSLGGITSGMPIEFRVAIKPTPSISKTQQSVNLQSRENTEIVIKGRHDACIVPRALPVVEAAAALAALDLILDEQPAQR